METTSSGLGLRDTWGCVEIYGAIIQGYIGRYRVQAYKGQGSRFGGSRFGVSLR